VRLDVLSTFISNLAPCESPMIAATNLPDSTKNLSILVRPKSVA
jgi:hypothetical protein